MSQSTRCNTHVLVEILGKWFHPICSSEPGGCLGPSWGLALGISWFPVAWQEPGRPVLLPVL